MRISDWSSDVCSSDLIDVEFGKPPIDLIRPTLTPLLDKFGAVPVAHLRAKTIFAHLAHGEHDMGVRFGETVGADVPMDIEVGDHAAFDKFLAYEVAGKLNADRKSTRLNSSH